MCCVKTVADKVLQLPQFAYLPMWWALTTNDPGCRTIFCLVLRGVSYFLFFSDVYYCFVIIIAIGVIPFWKVKSFLFFQFLIHGYCCWLPCGATWACYYGGFATNISSFCYQIFRVYNDEGSLGRYVRRRSVCCDRMLGRLAGERQAEDVRPIRWVILSVSAVYCVCALCRHTNVQTFAFYQRRRRWKEKHNGTTSRWHWPPQY